MNKPPSPGEYDVGPAVEWLNAERDKLGPGGKCAPETHDEALRWHLMFWALAAVEALHREENTTAALTYLEHAAQEVPAQFKETA